MNNEKIVGKLFGWNFSKGNTGWASSGSGTTWALSGTNLSISGGGGEADYTNFYRYNDYPFVFAGARANVYFRSTVNATNAWEGLGVAVKTNDNVLDFLVKVDLSATGTRGFLRIYSLASGTPTLLVTSSAGLSFTTGVDYLSLSLTKRADGFVVAKFANITTGNSIYLTTTTSNSWGNGRASKMAIFHFGGTQVVSNVVLENTTPKTKPTILIGDSLTNGMYFTYVNQAYGQAFLEAGSGASSSDIVSCLGSIINSGAFNAVLMIGMNDAIAGVSTSTYMANIRLIVNALTENGITPIICYVTPTTNSTFNTRIQGYNAALLSEYVTAPSGFAFIDTYTPLSVANSLTGILNSSFDVGDGIHLNSTGYSLLARTIQNGLATASDGLANPAKSADVQIFTSSGTWTRPAKAKAVYVLCIGPGSGGGSGAKMASGVLATGGGGGGSGAAAFATFDASLLTNTVTVTVGTGGAGGAAQATNSAAGNAGSLGSSNTTFGAFLSAARGAVAAGGGTNSGAAAGGTANSGMFTGVTGGASSATGGTGSNGGNSTGFCPSAGGGGGGVSTAPAAGTGGNGGFVFAAVSVQAAGGSATGANGTTGATYANFLGSGGGGGGGNTTLNGSGGTGGNGANYGGGGGGGGACLNGSGSSGAGGNGADGVCIVITYF
jgi:lysophospholipase L1-like esterase